MSNEVLWATSIFGAETRQGLVELQVGSEHRILRPTEARAFAYSILECAEAAETDEFIMGWLTERVGLNADADKVQVLRDFREKRKEMQAR